MNRSLSTLAAAASLAGLALFTSCGELAAPKDVMGNFEVQYTDNLRVYIGDELVAEVTSGEDADVEWDGQTFTITTLCSDEATSCPSETFWSQVAVDQPWGDSYDLLNFVNLDVDSDNPGQRMGGTMLDDGSFTMLSGLAAGGEGACGALGIGTVEGIFDEGAGQVLDGVIAYTWAGGCAVGEAVIGTSLRIESDFKATRTGDYDISSVTPEEPIDEEGDVVDPEQPDQEHAADEGAESVDG